MFAAYSERSSLLQRWKNFQLIDTFLETPKNKNYKVLKLLKYLNVQLYLYSAR